MKNQNRNFHHHLMLTTDQKKKITKFIKFVIHFMFSTSMNIFFLEQIMFVLEQIMFQSLVYVVQHR